jgi:hypothetical protein
LSIEVRFSFVEGLANPVWEEYQLFESYFIVFNQAEIRK